MQIQVLSTSIMAKQLNQQYQSITAIISKWLICSSDSNALRLFVVVIHILCMSILNYQNFFFSFRAVIIIFAFSMIHLKYS
jgi:hypothetical protein